MSKWIPWSTIRAAALAALRDTGFAMATFPEDRERADRECPGLAALLLPMEEGTPDPSEPTSEVGEPEFRLARISDRVLAESLGRIWRTPPWDPDTVEFIVRRGCRGHRNLKDAAGKEIPYKLETTAGGSVLLSKETFEGYVLAGVAIALAVVILRRGKLLEEEI